MKQILIAIALTIIWAAVTTFWRIKYVNLFVAKQTPKTTKEMKLCKGMSILSFIITALCFLYLFYESAKYLNLN